MLILPQNMERNDFKEERDIMEREIDGMELVIDGLKISVPEELIQGRMELLHFDTREDVIDDIKISLSGYIKCLSVEELNNPLLNNEIIEWLNSELQIFDPNNKFVFCPFVN